MISRFMPPSPVSSVGPQARTRPSLRHPHRQPVWLGSHYGWSAIRSRRSTRMDAVDLDTSKLGRLLDVGRALVAERDPEAVLFLVLNEARDLTGARYAALGVLDDDK